MKKSSFILHLVSSSRRLLYFLTRKINLKNKTFKLKTYCLVIVLKDSNYSLTIKTKIIAVEQRNFAFEIILKDILLYLTDGKDECFQLAND